MNENIQTIESSKHKTGWWPYNKGKSRLNSDVGDFPQIKNIFMQIRWKKALFRNLLDQANLWRIQTFSGGHIYENIREYDLHQNDLRFSR